MKKLLITLLTIPSISTAADKPWASFGGFYAGMTKAEAKATGYGSCNTGEISGEVRANVYCDIPLSKRQLGDIHASYAKLEFKSNSLNRVSQIQMRAEGKPDEIIKAFSDRYPGGQSSYESYRKSSNGHTLHVVASRKTKTAWVTFTFDPKEVGSRKEAERKKAAILKSF